MLHQYNNRASEKFVQHFQEAITETGEQATNLFKELQLSNYTTDIKERNKHLKEIETELTTLQRTIRPLRSLIIDVPSTDNILQTGFAAADAIDEAIDRLERHLQTRYRIAPVAHTLSNNGDDIQKVKDSMRMTFQQRDTNLLGNKYESSGDGLDDFDDDDDDDGAGDDGSVSRYGYNTSTTKSAVLGSRGVRNLREGSNVSSGSLPRIVEEHVVTPERDIYVGGGGGGGGTGKKNFTGSQREGIKESPVALLKTPCFEDFGVDVEEVTEQIRNKDKFNNNDQGMDFDYYSNNNSEGVDTSEWSNNAQDYSKSVQQSMRKMGIAMSPHELSEQFETRQHKALRNELAYATPGGVDMNVYSNRDVGDDDDDDDGETVGEERYNHLAAGTSSHLDSGRGYGQIYKQKKANANPNPNRELMFDEDDG